MEYISVILITILFTIFNKNISALQRDQKRIESKLDRIIEHLGLPEPSKEKINDELKDELVKLIEANKKVKAIKRLRDVTGMELVEAKDYVDSLWWTLRIIVGNKSWISWKGLNIQGKIKWFSIYWTLRSEESDISVL